MLKKATLFLANLKFLNSFVANNRQGVQFNKQFVGLLQQTID
jgi:hypothetical protein